MAAWAKAVRKKEYRRVAPMCFSPGSAMRIRLSAVLIAAFAFATSSPAPASPAPAAGNIELKIEPVRWNPENRTGV